MGQIFIGYMYSLPLPVNKAHPPSKAGTAENDIEVRIEHWYQDFDIHE